MSQKHNYIKDSGIEEISSSM